MNLSPARKAEIATLQQHNALKLKRVEALEQENKARYDALTPEQKPAFERFKTDMKARAERMATTMAERKSSTASSGPSVAKRSWREGGRLIAFAILAKLTDPSDVVLLKRELDDTSLDEHVRTFPFDAPL